MIGEPSSDVARSVAQRFAVLSATTFCEDGRTASVPDSSSLCARLADRIYVRCHLRQPRTGGQPADDVADDRQRAVLRTRLAGGNYMDDGWTLVANDGVRAHVTKGGLTLTLAPHELRHGGPSAACDRVQVRLPTQWPRVLPGWFVVISRHGQPALDESIWRVYGDVRPEYGADAAAMMRAWLEARNARFQLKLLDASALGTRPDGLVVFAHSADVDRAIRYLQIMRMRGWLRDGTPGFATRLAGGIGLAPELSADGRPKSFGQICSEVAAHAVIDAWRQAIDDEGALGRLVTARLEHHVAASALDARGERRCSR